MKKRRMGYIGIGLLVTFLLWTAAVTRVDVQAIGPNGSTVGFAMLNRWVHGLTGVHLGLYVLTDWLSLNPLAQPQPCKTYDKSQWYQTQPVRKDI